MSKGLTTGPRPGPKCIECGGRGRLTGGDVVYPSLRHLHARMYWVCPCGARVGCHPGGSAPLGYCAGQRTRDARQRAHATFDPIWKARKKRTGARKAGYLWLARQLGIDPRECHISMMDQRMALRVVEVCQPYLERIEARLAHRGNEKGASVETEAPV